MYLIKVFAPACFALCLLTGCSSSVQNINGKYYAISSDKCVTHKVPLGTDNKDILCFDGDGKFTARVTAMTPQQVYNYQEQQRQANLSLARALLGVSEANQQMQKQTQETFQKSLPKTTNTNCWTDSLGNINCTSTTY